MVLRRMAMTLRTVDLKRSVGANSGRVGNDIAVFVAFGAACLRRELEDFAALCKDFSGEESEGSGTSWFRGME